MSCHYDFAIAAYLVGQNVICPAKIEISFFLCFRKKETIPISYSSWKVSFSDYDKWKTTDTNLAQLYMYIYLPNTN